MARADKEGTKNSIIKLKKHDSVPKNKITRTEQHMELLIDVFDT